MRLFAAQKPAAQGAAPGEGGAGWNRTVTKIEF